MNNRALGTAGAVLLAIVLVIGVVGGTWFVQNQFAVTAPGAPGAPGTVPFYGTASFSANARTPFNETAITEVSNSYILYGTGGLSYTEWTKENLAAKRRGTFDAATSLRVEPADLGQVAVRIYPGTSHYLDPTAFAALNEKVVGMRNDIDIDGDGEADWLFQLDVSALGQPEPQVAPPVVVTVPGVLSIAGRNTNSPADVNNIGTSAATSTVEWTKTFDKFTALAISEYDVYSNRTSTNLSFVTEVKTVLSGVTIVKPMYGAISRAELLNGYVRSLTYNHGSWDAGSGKFTVPNLLPGDKNNANQAILIYMNPNTDSTTLKYTTSIKTSFTATGDGEAITIENIDINPAGNRQTADTDLVSLYETISTT